MAKERGKEKRKSTKLQTDQRVRSIQEWLMEGNTTSDILRNCTKHWGVTSRMGYNYLEKAYESFKELSEKDTQARLQFHIEARLKLYRELTAKQQGKPAGVALEILKDIAKLEGLYVERAEHSLKGSISTDSKHTVEFVNAKRNAELSNT